MPCAVAQGRICDVNRQSSGALRTPAAVHLWILLYELLNSFHRCSFTPNTSSHPKPPIAANTPRMRGRKVDLTIR